MAGGYPDQSIWVLLGNGDGTLLAEPLYGFATTVRALAAGDFNEDGRMDLADVWDFGTSRIDYMFGGPRGRFTTGGYIDIGTAFSSLQTADLNGDGHLDFATLDRNLSMMQVFHIDTYRAGGPAESNTSTQTESAVRITHLPTNTVVQSQKRYVRNSKIKQPL